MKKTGKRWWWPSSLPLLFLFLYIVIPGRAQLKAIATLVLAAACFKAVLAIYVRARFPQAEYATTHHDSMLFATAVCMVVAYLAEARSRRALPSPSRRTLPTEPCGPVRARARSPSVPQGHSRVPERTLAAIA